MNSRRPTRSLRQRLMRELLPSLVVLWIVSTGYILWRSSEELQEAYVDQIDQLAQTLSQILDESSLPAEIAVQRYVPRRDRNYFVVILIEDRPVLRSPGAPGDLHLPVSGEHPDYYLSVATARGGTLTIFAGVSKGEVDQLIANVVWGAALPMGVGIAAMALVLVLTIRRALRPLDTLRNELESRRAGALDPIHSAVPTELTPVLSALNHLLERLRKAIQQERRFVADASHELRTPLTAIRAQIETIDRSRLDPESAHVLGNILRAVERSTRLIQQLLRLARAEAIDESEAPVVSLDQLVTGIVSDLFPVAVRHDNELEVSCAPASVRGTEQDLEMLVGNLIENAIHHGGPGVPIRVSCGPDQRGSWFRVEDGGSGIPKEARQDLFQRFRRGSSTVTGAGLGLSIVISVAKRMNAEISMLDSKDLGGLCAEVRFPNAESGRSEPGGKGKANPD